MSQHQKIRLGLEKLLAEDRPKLAGARVGLLCNQASVDHGYKHAADLFRQNENVNLTVLFGPQHGIRGDVQDNMIETVHGRDRATGLPVYSLYSETREPTAEMLEDVDVLVCDLQDVGCRVYTFIYTIANCMRAAARDGKKVVVCDRPNPINGIQVEGGLLDPEFASFVGQFPIPMRHAMTAGELALMFRDRFKINCELEIIRMDGWRRELWYDETDAKWVLPSPNMPTPETATIFPATVLFEGTQISEGRGTTRPFEIVGAPFIEAREYAEALNDLRLPGVYFRPAEFLPTFQKHHGKACGGVQAHVTERNLLSPVLTGAAMVKVAYELYEKDFRWKEPPYEYVYDRNPFDVIAGTDRLRLSIEKNESLVKLQENWIAEADLFNQVRQDYLLY